MQTVIVMGEPRSGTTLLTTLLGTQPDAEGHPEYMDSAFQALKFLGVGAYQRLGQRHRRALFQSLPANWRHRADFSSRDFVTFAQLHRLAVRRLGGSGIALVAHSAHRPFQVLNELAREPDVVGVYVVRDIRDVVLSRAALSGRNAEAPVATWKEEVGHMLSTDETNVIVLRFEDLVCYPDMALALLAHKLGYPIDWPSRDIRSKAGSTWRHNSSFGDLVGVPDPRAAYRWKRAPYAPCLRYAEAACQKEMRALGYAVHGQPHARLPEAIHFASRYWQTEAWRRTNMSLRHTLQWIAPGLAASRDLFRRFLRKGAPNTRSR